MKRFFMYGTAACVAATLAALPCAAQSNSNQSNSGSYSSSESNSNSDSRNSDRDRSDRNNQRDSDDNDWSSSDNDRNRDRDNAYSTSDRDDQQSRNRDDQNRDRDDSRNNRDWDNQSTSRDRDGQRSTNSNDSRSDETAALGVMIVSRNGGMQVARVIQDSAANQAGLRQGDEIVSVEGRRFNSARQLAQAIRNMEPGDRVEVQVRRNGQTRTLRTRLDERDEVFNSRNSSSYASTRGSQNGQYGQDSQYGDSARNQRSAGYRGSQYDGDARGGDLQQLRREVRMLRQEVDRLAQRIDGGRDGSMTSGSQSQYDRSYSRDGRSDYTGSDSYERTLRDGYQSDSRNRSSNRSSNRLYDYDDTDRSSRLNRRQYDSGDYNSGAYDSRDNYGDDRAAQSYTDRNRDDNQDD